MSKYYTRQEYEEAKNLIQGRSSYRPQIGMILGSGLNPLAEAVKDADRISYADIPHFPRPTVEGHAGQLVLGRLQGADVAIMQGRVHFYEGYPIQQVVLPVRVMQVLGIQTLIVTNAGGGLNPQFQAGELMLIADHLNFIGMTGNNPLFGPNDESFGPRFPDMSQAYDPELRSIAREVAREHEIPLHEGVYAGLSGPSFETPAEIRFLRSIGADAVGMSTVPEVIVARHGGIRVLGVSGISNVLVAEASADHVTTHEEVLAAGQQIVPRLTTLICGVLDRLAGGS
ncbi:MAG: purine-nucleoside phosphorylase [Chloroflexi bacterium]|nr:MAG: purine-nucleoside phosphorylase [Chloroflexota bacterium]